ncbi:MAG: NAD-dependent epimerase/dehydratase family protein [Planctomycetaceae bacterium]|nr:NAD-dependent epimerase/dehydratase family protein [Planctomycetaceae bacterium]MCB9953904.1 NAD-dependent epimerase/dehydratase family protein [Planctomycetaceae bacterium]
MSQNLQGTTIGITGISGFLGRHIAERCLMRGAVVKGLDLHGPEGPEYEFILGDVTSPSDIKRLCAGCDVIIHTAAIVKEGGDRALFERVNVGGTHNVVEAAQAAGVRRFIHLSSIMVYGLTFEGEVNEESPLNGEGNPYCQTKIDSERVAMERHVSGQFDVVAVRSGDVYGPGSLPWTVRPIRMMKAGVFTLANGGRGVLNPVYIDNLVDAVLLVLQTNRTGEAYNITDGQVVTCRDFFLHYAHMLGRGRLRYAPAWLLEGSLRAWQFLLALFGTEPRIHPDSIAFVTRRGTYSIEKAKAVLGYVPHVDLVEGMRRTEEWARSVGLILPRQRPVA